MGIPGLLGFIWRNYASSDVIIRKKKTQVAGIFDHLYVDVNALIHPCAQKVFNYGQHKLFEDPNKHLTYEEKIKLLITTVIKTLWELFYQVSPTKTIMLAVDGVAPFAKQAQQRQRRYISALERKGEEFDSNVISPGTPFMFQLHLMLLLLCDSIKGVKRVVYSPYLQPGEGEHKILEYIRYRSREEMQGKLLGDGKHVIYSPDGDLVVLGLTLPCENFFVLRDTLNAPFLFDVVNVNLLRKIFSLEMTGEDLGYHFQFLSDFTTVCSILGNDFVPRIHMFENLRDGLSYILNKWGESKSFGTSTINLLYSLFRTLEKDEEYYLNKQLEGNYNAEEKFRDTVLEGSLVDGKISFDVYRALYYKREGISEEGIVNMCKVYVEMLVWIRFYYTVGITKASWRMRYPYFRAPLMVDLRKYIESIKDTFNENTITKKDLPVDPFLQLLFILPPKSKDNLPIGYRSIFKDEQNFPVDFEIDCEGKRQSYECFGRISFPDVDVLEKKYLEITKQLYAHYPRNRSSGPFLFFGK